MALTDHERARKSYIRRGYRRVDGWLERDAVRLLCAAARVQDSTGVRGAVAEIGIHHGKLFILLALLAGPGARGHAFDLFDRQEENADRSGRGDRRRFGQNLVRHGLRPDAVSIHPGNSLDLTPESIAVEIGEPVRLFSVDGGHTAKNTIHDLALATAATGPGGIVIVDDFFNQDWPGVAEGAMRFIVECPEALFPIVIGGNKILFATRPEDAEVYRDGLPDEFEPWEFKTAGFLGAEVPILSRNQRFIRRLKRTRLGGRLRDSALAERLRRWQRRLPGS